MKWQDISSAPRDGTRILAIWAYQSRPYYEIVFWSEYKQQWRGSDGGWGKDRWEDTDKERPTHWMPLPAPPALHEEIT